MQVEVELPTAVFSAARILVSVSLSKMVSNVFSVSGILKFIKIGAVSSHTSTMALGDILDCITIFVPPFHFSLIKVSIIGHSNKDFSSGQLSFITGGSSLERIFLDYERKKSYNPLTNLLRVDSAASEASSDSSP